MTARELSDFAMIETAVRRRGLILRGGFYPGPDDAVPALRDGRSVGTLLLVGNAGGGMWDAFQASPEAVERPDPLDRWSRRVIAELVTELRAEALFPFGGPPYHPFQRWAQKADRVWTSPLGILIHETYGLWHAYRGALRFAEKIDLPPHLAAGAAAAPCETCRDKPCLSACPVGAFSPQGYEVSACAGHISTNAGKTCIDEGCLARRACPVGRDYRYEAAQAQFHMTAFLRAREEA